MSHQSAIAKLSGLSARSLGVFRGSAASKLGVSRNQLTSLCRSGVLLRELPDTYRMAAVPTSDEQRLRAALLWAGPAAAAAGRSAGALYGLEGVRAPRPEIVVPRSYRPRAGGVIVHRNDDRQSLRLRRKRGFLVTGIEPTLILLAATFDGEAFEIACEDARRRRLTSIPALRAYTELARGRPGVGVLRDLLGEIDPRQPSRSTLEVKARRLLVANGHRGFVREFPLDWNGCTYRFDFCFEPRRTILETNGRRWHDDARDYEHDNEKWSVPGRHGYRIVLATWGKVAKHPNDLLEELDATLAA